MGISYLYLFLYTRSAEIICSVGKNSGNISRGRFYSRGNSEIRFHIRRESFAGSCEILAEITRIYEDVLSSSDSNIEGGGRDVQESDGRGYNGGDGRERRYGEASGGKYSRFQGNRVMTQFRKDR